jgi:predicted DNA-binding transcriptional regulator AlpA
MKKPLPGWPRGLSTALAASYVGLSTTSWLRLVDDGEAPAPVWITEGRKVWLIEDLDRWLDSKAGREQAIASKSAPALSSEWMAALGN